MKGQKVHQKPVCPNYSGEIWLMWIHGRFGYINDKANKVTNLLRGKLNPYRNDGL